MKFYCGYLNSGKAENYLLQSLSSVLTSTVQDTENRLARMDFKIAVELSMLAHMIAYHSESRIDESVFRKLHAKCVEEVKRLNGAVELNDACPGQSRTPAYGQAVPVQILPMAAPDRKYGLLRYACYVSAGRRQGALGSSLHFRWR